MKYRQRPTTFEAIQYTDAMRIMDRLPEGAVIVPTKDGDMPVIRGEGGEEITLVEGDYIITGENGEVSVCKKDVFEASYERA